MIVLSVTGLLLGCVLLAVLTGGVSRPLYIELPPGYRGWVKVQYEAPACPELDSRHVIFQVVSVDASGHACTSRGAPFDWTFYRYAYVYPDGDRVSLPHTQDDGEHIEVWKVSYSIEEKHECLFVGTEEDSWSAYGPSPCTGPGKPLTPITPTTDP